MDTHTADLIRGEFVQTVVGVPPDGWTLGHATIALRNPVERLPVEAWRRGAFAVHEVAWPSKGARLTHAPTGLKIWTFYTMDDAVELAERIEGMADWSAMNKTLPCGTELYPKVRAIIDEIVGRGD